MLPSIFLLLLSLVWAHSSQAAQVASRNCDILEARAVCQIRIEGSIAEGDMLFLSRVHDRDELWFGNRKIGSTGSFLGRPFHAGFFPRVYSLSELRGVASPILTLKTEGGLTHRPGIPGSATVKVINESYPLRAILGASILQILSFAFLVWVCAFLFRNPGDRMEDGWKYPSEESRWFTGSLCTYLLLRHEVSELLVPLAWSATSHLFAQRLSVFTMLWSLTLLLINGRFSDRSCIDRSPAHPWNHRPAILLANSAFITGLTILASFRLSETEATSLMALPALPLTYALGKSIEGFEWQRVLKRSSWSPFAFHLSLIVLAAGMFGSLFRTMVGQGAGAQQMLESGAWLCLFASGLRARSALQLHEQSLLLAHECRNILVNHSLGSARLQAFCDFVEEEWGAARVSVISVEDDSGLVLASSGPDAIPADQRADPRRLGPFLRRVCKQGQMLYAPVAEELGQDLQNQGLKHSSLAIPLSQENKVRAVVCMMADEGERIPPNDATQLHRLVDTLSLEILTGVSQHVAEDWSHHLMSIARQADALAVEDLDHWGHFRQKRESGTRVVLGGDCIPAGPFLDQLRKSPTFSRLWQAYRTELRSAWTAIAAAYEFIPKDNRDDFWVISPKEFRNPFLKELGPERVSILLANALERHSKALTSKDSYWPLGYCGVRLVSSPVKLRNSKWHKSAVEIDSDDFSLLLDLRQKAQPGTVLFFGESSHVSETADPIFHCKSRTSMDPGEGKMHSILQVSADKKELRKIEAQALDQARFRSRRAA